MGQDSLFGSTVEHAVSKAAQRETMRVLITVKAAPNPSAGYGETVCIAGIRLTSLGPRDWIRLYPINFRHLPNASAKFKKYDIVQLECEPATEVRNESWRPNMDTLRVEQHVTDWPRRRPLVDPMIENSMCQLRKDASADPRSRSLGLVRPAEVIDMRITDHTGWSKDEQSKIDAYVNQLDLFNATDKTPLQAPRFKGSYRWRCGDPGCTKHEQQILDWEFVALQRHLAGASDAEIRERLKEKFLGEVCGSDRQVAFYVGNQAKRAQTFSILGIYWPPKMT